MLRNIQVEEELENEAATAMDTEDVKDILGDTTKGLPAENPKKTRKTAGLIVLGLTVLGLLAGGWYLLAPSSVEVDRTAQQAKAKQVEEAQATKTEAVNKVIGLYEVPKTDANGRIVPGTPAPTTSGSPAPGMTIGAIGSKQVVDIDPALRAPVNGQPSPAPGQRYLLAPNASGSQMKPQASPTQNSKAGNSQMWNGANSAAGQPSSPNQNKSVLFDEVEVKKKDEAAIRTAAPSGIPVDPKVIAKKTPILGTMLPVTLMGAVYTHGVESLARLHLSRDIVGDGWFFKKGTLFVGKVKGSLQDRAFVDVIGYLDTETNQLIKLGGQVTGDDGGAGLKGNKKRLNPIMGKVLDRLLQSGTQILSQRLGRNNGAVFISPQDFQSQQQTSGGQSSGRSSRSPQASPTRPTRSSRARTPWSSSTATRSSRFRTARAIGAVRRRRSSASRSSPRRTRPPPRPAISARRTIAAWSSVTCLVPGSWQWPATKSTS